MRRSARPRPGPALAESFCVIAAPLAQPIATGEDAAPGVGPASAPPLCLHAPSTSWLDGVPETERAPLGGLKLLFIGPFNLSGNPITYRPGSPSWGQGWKEAVVDGYQNTLGLNVHVSVQSYRGNHLDLDPTYRDVHGRPLLHMTFDFHDNEVRMMRYLMARAEEIAREMGAAQLHANALTVPYTITQYQTTHSVGGTAMGTDPATSVVNTALQSWDTRNLFVLGGSVFPQNLGVNPTPTLAALAYHALGRITGEYLDDLRALDA